MRLHAVVGCSLLSWSFQSLISSIKSHLFGSSEWSLSPRLFGVPPNAFLGVLPRNLQILRNKQSLPSCLSLGGIFALLWKGSFYSLTLRKEVTFFWTLYSLSIFHPSNTLLLVCLVPAALRRMSLWGAQRKTLAVQMVGGDASVPCVRISVRLLSHIHILSLT